ncbi:hypothetical protein PR002_g29283 [Phytophthora rubi]|uniref:Uncharacterized protein n=1 Tax=Phytophthora rubi TaxID=129364 RepID=A0A6A3H2C2_9STRA|nr:hypothetical protein PR002_g29283 [Phytophthora rubi]
MRSSGAKSTRGKAWTSDEVLLLISAWKRAATRSLPVGHTTDQFTTVVYEEYIDGLSTLRAKHSGEPAEPNDIFLERTAGGLSPEGGLSVQDPGFRPRTHRPVKDKMASLKQSFTLVTDHKSGRLVGSTGKPGWFQMDTEERAQILKKWKRVAVSEECYTALQEVFDDDPSVYPLDEGVSIGASLLECPLVLAEPASKGKKRAQEAADNMEEILDRAVKNMRAMARKDMEDFLKHQQDENEKTRALLRELFGRTP